MLLGKSASDCGQKIPIVEGLGEERYRAGLHRGPLNSRIIATGDNDHTRQRRDPCERELRLQPAHFLHPDIEDNERNRVRFRVGKLRESLKLRTVNPPEASSRPLDFRTVGSSSTKQTTLAATVSLGTMHLPFISNGSVGAMGKRQISLVNTPGYWTLVPSRFGPVRRRRAVTNAPARLPH